MIAMHERNNPSETSRPAGPQASGPRRRPLVIEGSARRLGEGGDRPVFAGQSGHGASGYGSSRHGVTGHGAGRRSGPHGAAQPQTQTPSRPNAPFVQAPARSHVPGGHAPSFFKRRTEPEVDLFRHGGPRAKDAAEGPVTEPSNLPLAIALVAGVISAFLFVLPSVFGLTGDAATRAREPLTIETGSGDGLTFGDLATEISARNGEPVLTVSGRVSNSSPDAVLAPPIEIVLSDPAGRRIVRRLDVARRAVGAGESLSFSSSVLLPAVAAQNFEVSLRPVGAQVAK
ncbi:hypothetical protein DYI37_08235 [Fulvimarina endophytica]|uniref:DUF3426 domain-containing protein n=1 Tax=Fulvimarina endophytica TaxID=2293836 RepID=A0A371X504_9HYPH|nr:hypothetical protein [Fulvimarina endophytica]RFC64311.1 hypothetical protein DYI37_08235 [Fulvimarina endophytica]